MVINTVFTNGRYAGASRIASKVASRPTSGAVVRQQPRIINPTKDNVRDIERAAEARGRMNSMASSLQSAMASLESANKDIDRLTRELQAEREKNATLRNVSAEDVAALKDEILNLRADLEAANAELQRELEKNARAFQKGKKGKKVAAAQPEQPKEPTPAPEA